MAGTWNGADDNSDERSMERQGEFLSSILRGAFHGFLCSPRRLRALEFVVSRRSSTLKSISCLEVLMKNYKSLPGGGGD